MVKQRLAASGICRDARKTTRHSVQQDKAKRLVHRRHAKNIDSGIQSRHILMRNGAQIPNRPVVFPILAGHCERERTAGPFDGLTKV
jgi:hypothetical protein